MNELQLLLRAYAFLVNLDAEDLRHSTDELRGELAVAIQGHIEALGWCIIPDYRNGGIGISPKKED